MTTTVKITTEHPNILKMTTQTRGIYRRDSTYAEISLLYMKMMLSRNYMHIVYVKIMDNQKVYAADKFYK